ncbi:phosphoadenosine phosphosulfate reductase family protein [Aliivibrio fischeri]|uniref:phosphoadenosine phosphosulfate reductase domain-containing protein n=1 Tax=Aliivibrio fischeri TaxID=668 RepID=UPI0007C50EDC|nr:phosphoadenosine phosphosulfate reductase family protein [Aliivibrio fischeri]
MNLVEETIKNIQSLLRNGYSCSVSFSGGKDSSAVLVLFLEAVKRMILNNEPVPHCYITNSNTRREMPSIDNYLMGVLSQLSVYIAQNNLPITIVEVEPSLSGRFTWTTLGRGKLPRYEGQTHDCAIQEKIVPQQRAMKEMERATGGKIVALLGSRADESTQRRSNLDRHKMDEVTIVEINNTRTYAPISNWELDDVWELLVYVSQNEEGKARLFTTFTKNFDELVTLYRDANDGACSIIVGDGGSRSGCGSRFGCGWCTVTGERDKSLESLISENDELYGYMKGLVKFRKYLRAIRWDLKKRDFRGRNVSPAGYQKVTPDYFNPNTKRELFRFLLTLDALEVERAEEMERKWYNNEIEHTPENYLLTGVMFEFIRMDDVLAIDFCWSIGRDFESASCAAKDYLEVHEHGIRYHIPEIPEAPRTPIPPHRWFNVNPVIEDTKGIKGLVPINGQLKDLNIREAKLMEITPGAGFSYIETIRDHYYHLDQVDSAETCRAALHFDWIRMKKGDIERYDNIARRNDYLQKRIKKEKPLIENSRGNLQLMTTTEYLLENSISNKEHDLLLQEHERIEIENNEQMDIFGTDSILDMKSMERAAKKLARKQNQPKDIATQSVLALRDIEKQALLF